MVCVLLEAVVSKPFSTDQGMRASNDLLKPTKRSRCYHHITHVGSHLLANLSHIRNEVTLTPPVSRVFQEPSRQRARFSTEQVCAI